MDLDGRNNELGLLLNLEVCARWLRNGFIVQRVSCYSSVFSDVIIILLIFVLHTKITAYTVSTVCVCKPVF